MVLNKYLPYKNTYSYPSPIIAHPSTTLILRAATMYSSIEPLTMCFIIIIPLLFITIFLARLRQKLPYPPGPKGLPVIGNMLMMDQLTHRELAKLGKKYGGLCHLKMGTVHMVIVSSPDMAREFLQTQDHLFSNRPATIAVSYLSYNRADMALADYGPFWRQMRKICVLKLFSRKRAESWASVREEINSLVRTIATHVGSPVNLGELVFGLTKNITYKAAFGSNSTEGQDEFIKILQEFSTLFGAFNIADFFPWLAWIHAGGFKKRLENARRSLDKFIDKIIDEHMAKKNNDDSCMRATEVDNDMVDALLEFYSEEDGPKSDTIKVTRDNIKALIMDVMFGGTETVASAIEWTMAELMKNPNDLKKVQQELTDVVGLDCLIHESHLEQLSYLKCVVKETLRLHPPIPQIAHESIEDTVVNGYKIPAKSHIRINAWAIGRDETAWDEPDTFKPSRFLKTDAPDFKGSNFEFIPFGSGRRSCPGTQLGLYALELTLAHLCHCFTWELPDGMKPSELDMNDAYGATAPREIRLVVAPSHRLQCSLF